MTTVGASVGWFERWMSWFRRVRGEPRAADAARHDPFSARDGERNRSIFGASARAVGAAVDRSLLGLMKSADRFPSDEQLARVRREVDDAHALMRSRAAPRSAAVFHRAPPAIDGLEQRSVWFPGLRYEQLSFQSGFEPDAGHPGAARWRSYVSNQTAHAWVLRHADDPGGTPRPWLVCLHGLGTGSPWMDFPGFRAAVLHHRLGLNLMFPVLPLQGPRRGPGMDRAALVSFDLIDTLHGITQAVWDTRRLLQWIRAQGGERIGVFGLSVGSYVASLVSGLEDLDLAVAGIPVCDLPGLFLSHSPPEMRAREDWSEEVWGKTRELFAPIAPASLTPRAAAERRFIFAGKVDGITTPAQANRLWEAWDRCTIRWFDGGHVSYFWSGQVARFVDRALTGAGFRVPLR